MWIPWKHEVAERTPSPPRPVAYRGTKREHFFPLLQWCLTLEDGSSRVCEKKGRNISPVFKDFRNAFLFNRRIYFFSIFSKRQIFLWKISWIRFEVRPSENAATFVFHWLYDSSLMGQIQMRGWFLLSKFFTGYRTRNSKFRAAIQAPSLNERILVRAEILKRHGIRSRPNR